MQSRVPQHGAVLSCLHQKFPHWAGPYFWGHPQKRRRSKPAESCLNLQTENIEPIQSVIYPFA